MSGGSIVLFVWLFTPGITKCLVVRLSCLYGYSSQLLLNVWWYDCLVCMVIHPSDY